MIPTPHDALFKGMFSQPARAAELLRSFLDPALTARIDWTSLVLHQGSYVDDRLRALHADLLFRARVHDRREVLLYLLLEHQSTPDRWIALWLLRYVVNIWLEHIERDKKARLLPAILPAVVHHGADRWSIDTRFSSLVDFPADFPELAAHVPDFQYALADLNTIDADTLRTHGGSAATRAALLALKETRAAADLQRLIMSWAAVLNELEREPCSDHAIRLISWYLATVRGIEEIRTVDFRALGLGKVDHTMITFENYFLEQGREQGRKEANQQSHDQGQRSLLLRMLLRKFVNVPADIRQRVEAADQPHLELWGDRFITATTLDEIFAD